MTEHTMKDNSTTVSEESQRELAAGVLKQAQQDLRRFRRQRTPLERELYVDACRWIMSDDCSWPFSFVNVCELLGAAPAQLRRELLADVSLGTFGYWTRRYGRALSRLHTNFTQLLANDRKATATYA